MKKTKITVTLPEGIIDELDRQFEGIENSTPKQIRLVLVDWLKEVCKQRQIAHILNGDL